MEKKIVIVLALGTVALGSFSAASAIGPADEALPMVGTDNMRELSNGNLYPCIARPWGAHGWSPQTGDNDTGWLYAYGDRKIRGIRQTHQPSPWIGDYGQFSLMPAKELDRFDGASRASWFSHKTEFARPYTYRVYLADHDATVEIAPSCRAAAMRATYPKTDRPQFVVDAFSGGEIVLVDPRGVVEGVSRREKVRRNEKPRARPLENFFRIEFDRPFASSRVDGPLALLEFAPCERGERVNLRVASSFVSATQAKLNLAEVEGKDVDAVAAEGREEWNSLMARAVVETDDMDRRRMFYTCLYRAMLFPRRFFDIGADGRPVHRSPHTLEVLHGRYYCDSGFWDTFRSLFPLLNFLYPEMNAEMTEGLVHCYEEGGWLPEWSSPGYRQCMIGNNSASVVADALLSGAADMKYAPRLYEALLHGANAVHPEVLSEGRLGFEHYNEKGYVPRDVGIRESAARTLEYAYNDWCIWMLGNRIGRPAEELALYASRSGNWHNVFDTARGLACGRNADGSFDADFNMFKWGGDFTEGNALHYTWSVFHDVAGLIGAMGGREKFNATLDSIFELPPVFDESYYKQVIHEIREMQIMGFGQYAHGNQPIQHMPYLYDWSGEPWKTQKRVGEIVGRLYRPTPDGYCGDEDNGQTSAWYVWSCLGFYPVCPGTGEYALGAPQVSRARLVIDGKALDIRAVHSDGTAATDFAATPYVERLTLNGTVIDRNYVTREELAKGGELVFTMSSRPNRSRGTSAASAPYSYSTNALANEGFSSRREETLRWFREHQFGVTPVGRLPDERIGERSVAFEKSGIKIDITCVLPEGAGAEKPVPVMLFGDHMSEHKPPFGNREYPDIPTNAITGRGYAYVRWNFNDVAPNAARYSKDLWRWPVGIIAWEATGDADGTNVARRADSWGTLGAWAWGHSRVMDWIETRRELDASRVAVVGHSRGGKTALWAAAQDRRFAMAVSNGSGCGGARLGRACDPKAETFRQILHNFPNWFCPAFAEWIDRDAEVPHDADDLMRLVAPRCLYVASGSEDAWAGPAAEKAAWDAAHDAWREHGLEANMGYHCHEGPHKLTPFDWERFIDFADARMPFSSL